MRSVVDRNVVMRSIPIFSNLEPPFFSCTQLHTTRLPRSSLHYFNQLCVSHRKLGHLALCFTSQTRTSQSVQRLRYELVETGHRLFSLSTKSRRILGPIQHPMKRIPRGQGGWGRETHHPPPPSADVKHTLYFSSRTRLHGVVHHGTIFLSLYVPHFRIRQVLQPVTQSNSITTS